MIDRLRVPAWAGTTVAVLAGLGCGTADAQEAHDGISVPVPSFASNLTIDTRGLNITSDDGKVQFHVGGRLELDFGDGSDDSRFFDHAFDDHVEPRRARLDLGLKVQDAINMVFQYDFAMRNTPIADAAIAYIGLDDTLFTLGNFKEPLSLDQLISDTNTMFIERSLADALVPGRDTGFAVGANGDAWTFAAGVFGGNINDDITDDGIAGTARFTYAPINTASTTAHLGISGSFRAFGQHDDTISFSTDPEAHLFGANLIDTGDITDVDNLSIVGLEGAFRQDAFRAQGEYIVAHVERRTGASPTFQGGYVEAAYVLNGLAPKYSLAPDYGATYAIFGGVKLADEQRVSKGGFGVFEVAGRFSFLDLQDDNVHGGTERDWTAGLNWYPDDNLKVMTNYVHATADNSPGARGRNVEADIFEARLQVAY